MKYKASLIPLALLLSAGLSCDNPAALRNSARIQLVLVAGDGHPMLIAVRDPLSGSAIADSGLAKSVAAVDATVDGIRVTLTGPSERVVTSNTPGNGTFMVTIGGLDGGRYGVKVEGLLSNDVSYYGEIGDVDVQPGSINTVTVPFTSFQPVLASFLTDTTEVLRFSVGFAPVPNATGYIVRWAKSPTFEGASSRTLTTTSTEIQVPDEGKYYVSAQAVNATVASGGRVSDAKSVFVSQGVANVTVTPSAPTIGTGATQQFSAEAKDPDGAVVQNVVWYWASSNQNVAIIDQNGLVTGIGGGTAIITAMAKGLPGSISLTVAPPVPAKLAFTVQPSSATAGDALSTAVQVEIQDAAGRLITNARDAITIGIANNAGGGTLAGSRTVAAAGGIANFSGLWINKSGTGYTLSASSGSLTSATSSGFNISAAAATKLAFSVLPSDVEANIAMPLTVKIADQFDNTVNTATNTVTLSISNNPWKNVFSPGANLKGTLGVAAVAGVATFSDVRVDKPGTGFTIAASGANLTAVNGSPFNVHLTVQQISSGNQHVCAIATGGAFCWGDNNNSQLGFPTYRIFLGEGYSAGIDSIPGLVLGDLSFVKVAAGQYHSCGLTATGAAYCWGRGYNGELGDGTSTTSLVPVPVAGNHVFSSIAGGGYHTCGITQTNAAPEEDRQVYCWGSNSNGQLGDNSAFVSSATPVRVAEPLQTTSAVSITAGYYHTCVVATDANVYCWGYNGYGQVGNGDTLLANMASPALVTGGLSWLSVSAGTYHTCGIATDNTAQCWGYGGSGQLGDGGSVIAGYSAIPVAVVGGLQFTSVSAGSDHTCGLSTGAAAYCWGYNYYGQLGDGNRFTTSNQPVAVLGGYSFSEISAGGSHSCGRNAAEVFCWGRNFEGQLGSPGTNDDKLLPTKIVQ